MRVKPRAVPAEQQEGRVSSPQLLDAASCELCCGRDQWRYKLSRTCNVILHRDMCSEIDDVTIPYSNCSQSIKDSLFVSISTLVPTTNAKSLTPLFRGDSENIYNMHNCSSLMS